MEGGCPPVIPGPGWSLEPSLWGFRGGLELDGGGGAPGSGPGSCRFSYRLLLPLCLRAFPGSPRSGSMGFPFASAFPSEKCPDFPGFRVAAGVK